MTLDPRELATVLAGLRSYQHMLVWGVWPAGRSLEAIHDTAGDGCECLSPEDIDDLCDRLNAPEDRPCET